MNRINTEAAATGEEEAKEGGIPPPPPAALLRCFAAGPPQFVVWAQTITETLPHICSNELLEPSPTQKRGVPPRTLPAHLEDCPARARGDRRTL